MARSLIAQTHQPERWVIVDDGSSDGTSAIAAALADEHGWITVVPFAEDGDRSRGGRIVRAFEAGLAAAGAPPPDVVQLHAATFLPGPPPGGGAPAESFASPAPDFSLPSHYFEWVAQAFGRVPRAGVVGGIGLVPDGAHWQRDVVAAHTVNGIAKAYRTECLRDIGGL